MTARQARVYDATLDEWVEIVGPPGPEGPPGADGTSLGDPVFIQDTDPALATPYAWFDTTGGNISLWIEDGI